MDERDPLAAMIRRLGVEQRLEDGPDLDADAEVVADGLYSYYRATSLGEGILQHGVRELMAREWDALEEYS